MLRVGPSATAMAWLIGHITGAIGAWAAFPTVQLFVAWAHDPRSGWGRFVALHVAGYATFSLAHCLVMIPLRYLVALITSTLFYVPTLRIQVIYEAQADLLLYPALAGLWHAIYVWDERRESELRTADLERALAQTRLDALTARLDPHFLFNALHTISASMHEDVERTESLLAILGDILRVTLGPATPVWTLAEERAHAERGVELLETRFGDRLSVRWESDEGASHVRVPRFAIQSLIENAVKHNPSPEPELHVVITIALEGEMLHVRVDDDGRGFSGGDGGPTDVEGRGLVRLEETLSLVFASGASLERDRAPSGGARVTLRIPATAAPA